MNPVHQSRSTGFAIARVRHAVIASGWILGICLIAQVVIWAMASFTDVRSKVIHPQLEMDLVVASQDRSIDPMRAATSTAVSFEDTLEPVVVSTKADQLMHDLMNLSRAAGTIALLVLAPLALAGLALIASQPTTGVDKVVSACVWALVLTALMLPVGQLIDLPWGDGALRSYDRLTADIADHQSASLSGLEFYGRYLMQPGLCAIGLILLCWRYRSGTEHLLPLYQEAVDPRIEREAAAAAASASSLHGQGRSAGVMRNMAAPAGGPSIVPDNDAPPAPKRLI